MPRLPRIHLDSAVYFVTLEGPYNEAIFRDHSDYMKYIELLNKCRGEYQFKLYSYAFLTNYLYLLIEPAHDFPISQIMHWITPLYTKYYNARYDRKGPLFQKRFRSVIVEKGHYLPYLTRYMHFLTQDQSGKSQEKQYSSCAAYTQKSDGSNGNHNDGDTVINLDNEIREVMTLLPPEERSHGYEGFLLKADRKEMDLFERRLSRTSVFGSDSFIADVRRLMAGATSSEAEIKEAALEPEAIAVAPVIAAPKAALGWFALVGFSLMVVTSASVLLYTNRHFEKKSLPASQVLTTNNPSQVSQTPKTFEIPKTPELNGTVWDVELYSVSPEGVKTPMKDKIKFMGEAFESHHFSSQGFQRSNYSVTVQDNGTVTWETMQTNPRGETISWRGDWNGKTMEGMISYQSMGKNPQDFSFLSKGVGGQRG